MRNVRTMEWTFLNSFMVLVVASWCASVIVGVSPASAAACPDIGSGRIFKVGVKGQPSIVIDGKRFEFSSKSAFATWSKSAVKAVDVSCNVKYPKIGVIGFNPGSVLVQSVDKGGMYAVSDGNTLRKVPDATIAQVLYGAKWKSLLKTIPRSEFDMYIQGDDLTENELHNGMLVKEKNDTFVNFVWNGQMRFVKGKLPSIARNNVRIISPELFDSIEVGDPISASNVANAAFLFAEYSAYQTVPEPVAMQPNVVAPSVKSDTGSTTINGTAYQETNYSGTFPAPEGIIVKGYYGVDTYQIPVGSGSYRFKVQTGRKRELVCLDSTRMVQGSKGLSFESGYAYGRVRGEQDLKLPIPYFDDTPINVSGNATYFREGYTKGYAESYGGQRAVFYYDCGEFKQPDVSKYDADGWYQYTELRGAPGVKSVFLPTLGVQYATDPTSPKSLLSPKNVNAWSMPTRDYSYEKTDLNSSKAPLNFSRIDVYESEYDATEAVMPLEGAKGMTQAVANVYQNTFKTDVVLKTHCSLTPANISYQTYGGNRFGLITFVSMCKPSGWSTFVWKNHAFAITQAPSTKGWVVASFVNNDSVKAKDSDEFDMTKAQMSSEFIAQFLTKLQLK